MIFIVMFRIDIRCINYSMWSGRNAISRGGAENLLLLASLLIQLSEDGKKYS